MRNPRCIFAFFLPCLLLAASAEAATQPVEVVQSLVDRVKSFKDAPEGDRAAAAEKIHGLLDIEGLAQRSLMTTWDELDAGGRKAFVALLSELLATVAYPQSAKFFEDLKLEYEDTGKLRGKRVVLLSLTHPDEGLIEIEFFLHPKTSVVQDISIDGVSLALDIRSQMQRIIREDGFDTLESKMKKKIAEA